MTGLKCRVCREPAIIDLRRHNANFCTSHFLRHCRQQVERAIAEFEMLNPDDRILVAVSGGKDSFALWDILIALGYHVDGLYVGLGIGDYSKASNRHVTTFVQERSLHLETVDLSRDHGFDVPSAAEATGRVPCSACGLSKRHIFDKAAMDGGYDAVVTGHNLDDEAAVLYGNVLRWQVDYLARQRPLLEAGEGFPRKAKPLIRLTERETAAYCILRGIEYQVEECPMAVGNKHLAYKEALNHLEEQSPGSKSEFYFGYLKRVAGRLVEGADDRRPPAVCTRCGSPAETDVCAFCRLVARTAGTAQPVAVAGGLDADSKVGKPK